MNNRSGKPTKLGLSGHQGAGKRWMLSWWAHWRYKDTCTRTSLTSRTPTHTQHKEISPFSATQSLRTWFPFQCYSGVVEKKSNPLALSMWFPDTPGFPSNSGPHHHSHAVRRPTTTFMQQTSNQNFGGEKQPLNLSWPYRGQNDSTTIYNSQFTRKMQPTKVGNKIQWTMKITTVHDQ